MKSVVEADRFQRQVDGRPVRCHGRSVHVIAAVSNSGNVLRHADDMLKVDSQVVAAVSRWPGVLQQMCDDMKADKGIVIAAVSKDGHCLMDTHTTLRADFDIVKIAVSSSGKALHWASPQLWAGVDLMVTAMRDTIHDSFYTRDVTWMIGPLKSDVPRISPMFASPCCDHLSILGGF